METNCPLNIIRNLEEMDREQQKKKKRGRAEEDSYYKNYLHQAAKIQDMEHCNNSVMGNTQDSSKDYKSALGVFDFPWMLDGIVSKSQDWNYVEDTTFSSSLADTCRCRVKFSENFDESEDGRGLETDCIWASLLHQGQGGPNEQS
ncbi:hypothetical protein POUND7_002318 [Theobroma cacao]